jgi:Asp-tRNA(Asn)/Glu-tRNA(Gln) amidotransferase A subunit family amidase
LSSREVVQAHLDRIESINPKVHALGPLHGVPFTIKDAIDTLKTNE